MNRKLLAASSLVVLLLAAAFARQNATPNASPHPGGIGPAHWLVLFELGPKFDSTKLLRDQPGFMEHVTALKKLEESGALLVGGPLLESAESHKPTGAAWIVEAPDAEAAKKVAESDPFVSGGLSKIQSIRYFFAGSGAWIPTAKPAGGDAKQH